MAFFLQVVTYLLFGGGFLQVGHAFSVFNLSRMVLGCVGFGICSLFSSLLSLGD